MSYVINETLKIVQNIFALMEEKDRYTLGHSEHVQKLVEVFYNYLPNDIKPRINLERLKDAALLHDIGKIIIPVSILNKSEKLTVEEWNIVLQHPEKGKSILEKTCYRGVCDIVLYHHERVDGKGYYGVPEKAIPLEAKIITVADTFSSLFTDRAYRKRYSYDKAVSIMKGVAGTQLDAVLVDIFCNIPKEFITQTSDSIIFKR